MNRKIVSTLVALCLFVSLQGQAILHTNPVAQGGAVEYPEMITNGTFDADTSWEHLAYWTVGAGVATYDDLGYGTLAQIRTAMVSQLVESTDYTLKFDVICSGAEYLRIRVYSYEEVTHTNKEELIALTNYVTGSYSLDFTTPGVLTGYGISFYATPTGDTGSLDNVSLKQR